MAADARTRRSWEIAEKLGDPVSRAFQAFEAVCDELRPVAQTSFQYLQIASRVRQWVETRNPHYLDVAVILCGAWSLPITETVQEQLGKAAKLRMTGGAAGTPDKIAKETALGNALMLMANLIYEGLTVPQAASKAAAIHTTHKASSLERYYSERVRKVGLEAELFTNWERTVPDHREVWLPIVAALPDTPEAELGSRR